MFKNVNVSLFFFLTKHSFSLLLDLQLVFVLFFIDKNVLLFSQHKLISKFPVEAGYFHDGEKIVPDCPFKKTPFGIKQAVSDEGKVGKMLSSYLKVC